MCQAIAYQFNVCMYVCGPYKNTVELLKYSYMTQFVPYLIEMQLPHCVVFIMLHDIRHTGHSECLKIYHIISITPLRGDVCVLPGCVWMQVLVLLLWSEQRLRGFAELSSRPPCCVAALCQPILHLSDLTLVVMLFLPSILLNASKIQRPWMSHDNTQMYTSTRCES